jgi:hypothetical protein
MTRVPMAACRMAYVGACLVGAAAGCAGSAPKTTTPATASGSSPPVASAPASSSSADPTASSAAPAPASSGAPASPAQSGAPLGPATPGSAATPALDSAATGQATGGPPAPVTSAPLAPLPVPEAPPPAPQPTPRILLADELPYSAAHLRAHDSKAEHRRARDASREGGGTREAGKRPYHPAPGIVVDVVASEGGGSAADLQRAARNLGYWPFRQCYEDGLRSDPHLAGKVSLELVVGPSGVVDRSVVTATTVRDEIVSACVAREARHLALPTGESPTTAKVDVSLSVGDEPVPAGRPVPNAEPLRDALRGSWGAVRRCYASRLAGHPGIGGRMELRLRVRHGEIVEAGEVGAGEGGGRFGDGDVTRCVLGVYRTARLPASAHAAREHSFVYALHFESVAVDEAAP